MEIIKGNTYFDNINMFESIKQYPYLDEDIDCDILVIGGGIEGALVNYYLSNNYKVVLVEKTRLGRCSTCVATALLEFQLDSFAHDLKSILNSEDIIKIYSMGLGCLKELDCLINRLGNHCYYKKKPSLLYSDRVVDISKIKKEFEFRKQNGVDCKYMDTSNCMLDIDIKAGIFDKNGGAELNPYLFEKQLIQNSVNQKNIYENTEIVNIQDIDDYVIAHSKYGYKIRAKKVIISTGFDYTLLDTDVQKLLTMMVSYTIVTSKISNLDKLKLPLIQDAYDNYHYLRTLPDERIIFGGEDTKFNGTHIDAKIAKSKYQSLTKNLNKILKRNNLNFTSEYEFCGLFASTENNLGIIGQSKFKNIYYFLSCGANGIINTFCGIEIIKDLLEGKSNEFEKYFSPLR